jgi:hypothetical protein
MNIRQNRREPAKADRRQHSGMRRQYESCDPYDIRPGHQLGKGQSLGKFLLAHPLLLLDHSAASPNEPTAETAERNLKKADE